jgi:hypothetical protein
MAKAYVHTGNRLPESKLFAIKGLLEAGYSCRRTAAMARCSLSTVIAVKRRPELDPDVVTNIKRHLSGKFYRIADESLDGITDEKLQKASAPQLMTMAAIGIDKARLIEGQTTERTEFVNWTDRQLEAEIAQLEAELEKIASARANLDATV